MFFTDLISLEYIITEIYQLSDWLCNYTISNSPFTSLVSLMFLHSTIKASSTTKHMILEYKHMY